MTFKTLPVSLSFNEIAYFPILIPVWIFKNPTVWAEVKMCLPYFEYSTIAVKLAK
jgi:hypothetical protein